MVKKVIFFILGAAITFIVVSFAMSKSSSDNSIYIAAAGALFGGLIGSSLVKRTEKAEGEGGIGKAIVWILVIAIIIVAVIAFIGMNK